MKATFFDKDGNVIETKNTGNTASKMVLDYYDGQLFFDIPESIMEAARTKTGKLERLYLLDRLRFLIKYDFELYMKSDLCALQSTELSHFLKDLGCKDYEELAVPQSSDYKPSNAYPTLEHEMFRAFLRKRNGFNLAEFRHYLINTTKRNNIKYSRIIRNPQYYGELHIDESLCLNTPVPDIAFLISLLSPLGDISEKQMLQGNLLEDNKFVLSIARTLYRTDGIYRSYLYNLLRLFLPTKNKVKQTQGLLNFSRTYISTQEDNFVIENKNELGCVVSTIEISKDDLAAMFSASSDGKSMLDAIQEVLKIQFNTYLENCKEQVESDLSQGVFIEYQQLDQPSWKKFLSVKYKTLKNEYEQYCNDDNIYATPYFLYGIILKYDRPNSTTEITPPLTIDVIYACTRSKDNNLIPFYKEVCSLNHIKSQAGLIEESNCIVSSEAIDNAMKYIEPIANVTFLSPNTTPKDFKELFRRILSTEPLNELIEEHTFKFPFNLKMLLNIIGMLRDKNYFSIPSSKIDNELGEKNKGIFEKKVAERRAYIDSYRVKDTNKAYILNKRLIDTIENIIQNYEMQKKR